MSTATVTENVTPFEALGRSVVGSAKAEDILVKAGLNWEVVEQPLKRVAVDGYRDVPGYKALVRSDTDEQLATVRSTYNPIQNIELAEIGAAFGEIGVTPLRGGELNGGKVVWLQMVVSDREIRIAGDDSPILPFVSIATGHDALRSLNIHRTPIRQFCGNQADYIANSKQSLRVVAIRHTRTAQDRIKVALKQREDTLAYFDEFERLANQLVAKRMTLADVKAFTKKLIPGNPTAETAYKSERQRDEIVALIKNAANLNGMELNGWKVVQAVTEWADHSRTYRATKVGNADDARALAVLDGTAQRIKDKAVTLLLPSGRGAGGRFAAVSAN